MNNFLFTLAQWKTRVNIWVKPCVNHVRKNVKNFYFDYTPCKTSTYTHIYNPLLRPLFTSSSSPVLFNTYPLLHRPYYYNYYIFINNINNRKD